MFVAFDTTNEVCNCASSPASRAAESHSGARRATERRSSSGATRARGGGERMANMAAAMPYLDRFAPCNTLESLAALEEDLETL